MEFVTVNIPKPGPVAIMPLGDIQYAGKGGPTAMDLLKHRIDDGLKAGALFIGMGDYIDFMSPSNRQKRAAAAFYDWTEEVIDEKSIELTHDIYEKALKPTKGRWIGLLQGHHFTKLSTGETTDQKLAELLGTQFLGDTVYGRLAFKGHGDVTFWASHGCGGGQRSAAPVNKLETLANYWEADIFMLGHMTKMAASPINRIYPLWKTAVPHLRHKKILLVGCGGFCKGYIERSKIGRVPQGSYVEKGLMNPAILGNPLIRVGPNTEEAMWQPNITVEL